MSSEAYLAADCVSVLSVMMQHRLPVYTTWHYCDARSKYLITS